MISCHMFANCKTHRFLRRHPESLEEATKYYSYLHESVVVLYACPTNLGVNMVVGMILGKILPIGVTVR